MRKYGFFVLIIALLFAVNAKAQTGFFTDALKSSVDSTATFQVVQANTVTSLNFQFVPAADGFPGTEFPDVINYLFDITSRNDSTNVTFQLWLSADGTTFRQYTTDLGSKVVSGTANSSVLARFTNIPGFRYGQVNAVGAMAAADTLDIKIWQTREFH